MGKIVECDSGELLRQASLTAEEYLRQATSVIDARFGKDYAKDHPDFVAAFMKTAAEDFKTCMFAKVAENCTERLTQSLDRLIATVGRRTSLLDCGFPRPAA